MPILHNLLWLKELIWLFFFNKAVNDVSANTIQFALLLIWLYKTKFSMHWIGGRGGEWLKHWSSNPKYLTSVGSNPGQATCEKMNFLVGPYWLARCQYNVTEWCAILICDIVRQCASTLKGAISVSSTKQINTMHNSCTVWTCE